VARKYQGILEYEDALQEAYIAVATNPETVRTYLDGHESHLKRWVWERVTDVAKGYLARRRKDVSLEALAVAWGDE
jgi:DNA-directed RNA polymerase specialized sigma24 family protein